MVSILKLILKQFVSFFGILFLGKILFCFYHFSKFSKLYFEDKIGLFLNGFKLDISISTYFVVIPFVLLFFANIFEGRSKYLQKINKFYHLTICILTSFVIVIDLELFRAWGIRVDNSPLKYMENPTEMWASISASPFYILLPIFILLIAISIYLNKKIFGFIYSFNTNNKIISSLILLFLIASLIVPIRGGLQLAPINQSSVYFSKNNFANLAAVNPIFNLLHSFSKKTNGENPYNYMAASTAKAIVDTLFIKNELPVNQLIVEKPNVLIITWESLTAKVLNQKIEVVPNLKRIMKEGIYFENCYATGDRSDKGMVAILSGYPAQPTTSIIQFPQKTAKLPIISKDLMQNGYSTAWYYGGEPEFANMKSYFLNGQFGEIITKENFPENLTENSKWGANDSLVFDRLFIDLNKKKEPFFVNYFTLSSHEPYEVAGHQAIKGFNETSKFLNAHNYTDKFFGAFIEKAKKQAWYKNTLIIVLADHGHRLPLTDKKQLDFKIPMLWFGGALKAKPYTFSNVCSQNDLAKTLLNQLNISSLEYTWSKDIFTKNYKPFAYFAFNDGFGWIKNDKSYTFDNIGKRVIQQSGTFNNQEMAQGKAYLQTSFADYLAK